MLSRTSIEVLGLLENLEIDAGGTYLDNEPLGRVRAVPLYHEHYRLLYHEHNRLLAADSPLGDRDQVTWEEVGRIPLCLLTPDMQNRRIIDRYLRAAGVEPAPTLESTPRTRGGVTVCGHGLPTYIVSSEYQVAAGLEGVCLPQLRRRGPGERVSRPTVS